MIADIDLEKAQTVAAELQGQRGQALKMDVTDEAQVNAGVTETAQRFGGVDVLVSNAGFQKLNRLEDVTLSDWKQMMAVHLDGAFLTTRACLKDMYRRGTGGSIIYMGSTHSKLASPLKAPYTTAKHGLIGLCKAVAKEGAQFGVRANVICPGFVLTPLVQAQIPQLAKTMGISEDEVVKNVMLKDTVDGEFTTTQDVAQVAVLFSTFETNALTGQSLVVGHGWFME